MMKLYNVANTADDKPKNYDSWIEALEQALGYKIPNKDNLIGAHMSEKPGQCGPNNVEYIAAIKEDDNNEDNTKPIYVDKKFVKKYSIVKKIK